MGHDSSSLRRRARPLLKALRDEFNETTLLSVLSADELVLVDVVEGNHMLKFVPPVGMIVDPRDSAAGHAMLSHMNSRRRFSTLGEDPNSALLERLEQVRESGYAVHRFDDHASIAAAVLEANGEPGAAIVLTGPLERIKPERYREIGTRIAEVAKELSASMFMTK
jgi:IclR family acetate operon transcriptional repressor